MKSFIEVVKSRKSIRSFSDKKVSKILIEKILALGVYAPTNCNQQLWNVVVIDDKKTKQRLIKDAAGNTLIQRAPVALVVTYDGWNYKEALQGASLMVGHILLAAEYFGLGALPMNSYGSDKKIKTILRIPNNQTICCFILLGYPDESAQHAKLVQRRDVSEVVHYGKFSQKNLIPFTYDPNDWTLEHLRMHHQYYARKTVGGKEMDIMSGWERSLVHDQLQHLSGNIADIFSYDGAYLREFPNAKITTIDLTAQTAQYSAQAVHKTIPERAKMFSHNVYEEKKADLGIQKFDAATILFKLERTPRSTHKPLFKQVHNSLTKNGEILIISRSQNPLLMLSLWMMKLIFGNDVRKTGIFAFFGPYTPISTTEVTDDLEKSGFIDISAQSYFAFPTVFDRFFQMVLQYRASDGSSYLHRIERTNSVTRILKKILALQGFRTLAGLGSVVVIKAKKR